MHTAVHLILKVLDKIIFKRTCPQLGIDPSQLRLFTKESVRFYVFQIELIMMANLGQKTQDTEICDCVSIHARMYISIYIDRYVFTLICLDIAFHISLRVT